MPESWSEKRDQLDRLINEIESYAQYWGESEFSKRAEKAVVRLRKEYRECLSHLDPEKFADLCAIVRCVKAAPFEAKRQAAGSERALFKWIVEAHGDPPRFHNAQTVRSRLNWARLRSTGRQGTPNGWSTVQRLLECEIEEGTSE